MEAYEISYKILASDVDVYRRLRISRLFTFLQEAAIAHTEALGAGRAMTLDRGLLWVVTIQEAKIARLPEYDETVKLVSLPGKMMHAFYPRYYKIVDANGDTLVNASALWMLMDQKSRALVFPDVSGVFIEDGQAGWDVYMPRSPKLPQHDGEETFTVPYSYADLNGHMNNTRYFDLAEDLMPKELRSDRLLDVRTEYTSEAKVGDALTLHTSISDGEFRLSGMLEDKRIFRLSMLYANEGGAPDAI